MAEFSVKAANPWWLTKSGNNYVWAKGAHRAARFASVEEAQAALDGKSGAKGAHNEWGKVVPAPELHPIYYVIRRRDSRGLYEHLAESSGKLVWTRKKKQAKRFDKQTADKVNQGLGLDGGEVCKDR